MIYPTGTFLGNYPPLGDLNQADCSLALEFSHRPDARPIGTPNIATATRIDTDPFVRELPLFASHSITKALHYIGSNVTPQSEFVGESAQGLRENLGTWGELAQAKQLMSENGYNRPVVITSGYNIGNVVLQCLKIGIDPIVPPNLPRLFDPDSDQLWTRNHLAWMLLATPRLWQLRRQGH